MPVIPVDDKNSIKLKLGCDPEVFIRDKATSKFICAHGYVPGTKQKPFPLPDGMVQVDGFAVEFGIKPALTKQGFVNRILRTRELIEKDIQSKHSNNLELVAVSTAPFDPEAIEAAPAEAKELGCDPDYNAYTGAANPRPNATGKNYRTGGGHVHIGWTKGVDPGHPQHFEACCMLAKQLDVWLGLPSMFWDNDKERRTLYGAPGAFRPKPYGMEYRSLSNRWLRHTPLIGFVYDQTVTAFNRLLEGKVDYLNNNAVEVINSDSRSLAKYICEEKLGMSLPRRSA